MEKNFTREESSTVRRVKYKPIRNILEVEFTTGGIYHYAHVPQSVADELFKSEKVGSFVKDKIKGVYTYTKVN